MPHEPSGRSASVASKACLLVLSAALAGALAGLLFLALPDELDVETDIVGYPTFANFNIDRYFWIYGLVVVFFPLVTLGIYVVATRILLGPPGPRGPIPRPVEEVEAVPVARGRQPALVAAVRTLLVGAVLALESAIVAPAGRRQLAFVAVAAGWSLAVGLAAWLAARVRRADPFDVASTINVLAAPLAVGALWGVSEATDVTVSATGAVHEYPWLPAWLAFGAAATLLVWLGTRLRRGATPAERSALERRVLLLVVAPVGLYLFVASLRGELGLVDLFEDGQFLAGMELTRDGAFPWRDLLAAHGLLRDVGYPLVGASLFEDSYWGAVAGNALVIRPLLIVLLYYLCAYLFGSNWLFLLGSQALIVSGHIFVGHLRFILLPVVLLLLVALLRRASVLRAVAFTALLAVQMIVTPEAIAAGIAYVGVLVLFELYYYERGIALVAAFRRTWLCLAAAFVLTLAWSAFLLAHGALDDFVFSYQAFIPGHRFTGGIPVRIRDDEWFEALAPVVLVLAAFAFVVAWTRARRPLAFRDWAMLATAALTLGYYTKFLSRADLHVYQSFAAAVPLLFYAAYRAVTFAEEGLVRVARARGVSWFPARHTVTLPLLLGLLAVAPIPLHDIFRNTPHRFSVAVDREPEVELIGYSRPGANDTRMIADVGRTLEGLLEPGDAVFDFTNAPGLFHYLLDIPSSTRYFNVSIASRMRTQTDLIVRLEKDRPRVAVFTSDGDGRTLYSWDGLSNQVRHYDVSEYLLDHYVPVVNSHGYVLMQRREDGARARPELYFDPPICDWGYAPNFFTPAPDPVSRTLTLPVRTMKPVLRLRGWAIDPAAGTPAVEVVAAVDGRVVASTRRRRERSDVADYLDDSRYVRSGFALVVPESEGLDENGGVSAGLRVYALMRSGDATEIPGTPVSARAAPVTALVLPDGRRVRIVPPSQEQGYVDGITVERPLAVTLPARGRAADYRWLEVRTGKPLAEGRFEIADRLDEIHISGRVIGFGALDRGETSIRVFVGACSQWRGYRSRVLYLTSTVPQDVREVRLLRD